MNSRRRSDGFQESSIGQILGSPIRYLRQQIARLFGENDSMKSSRSSTEKIISFLTFPFRLFFAFIIFLIQAWTTSRNGFAFIRGLPALLVFGLVCGAIWAINFRYDINILRTQQRFEISMVDDVDNPEYTEMYAEKLLEFAYDVPENKYRLGLARERVGNLRSALILMTQIAGEDSSGFIPAHNWLARYYAFNEEAKNLPEEEREALGIKHFNIVLEADPENIDARIGLSQIYENKGDLESAASQLKRALGTGDFQSMRQLAHIARYIKIQQELGRDEEVNLEIRDFIKRLDPLTRYLSERFEIWLVQIQCASLMKDYELAKEIIEDARQTVKDNDTRDRLTRLYSEISVLNADDYESIEDINSYQGRLFALCDAIRSNPGNRSAYNGLIEFVFPETLVEEKAIWLRDSILGCPNPAVIHVILGMQAIKQGDFVQGQKQWSIADSQFDLSKAIVNNLIEVAIAENLTEFGNPLDMITVALELFPDQIGLYQTRAIYYKNQQQYDKAIAEFKLVLEKLPNLMTSRFLLMKCYEAIGDSENAALGKESIDKSLLELDPTQRATFEAFMKANSG